MRASSARGCQEENNRGLMTAIMPHVAHLINLSWLHESSPCQINKSIIAPGDIEQNFARISERFDLSPFRLRVLLRSGRIIFRPLLFRGRRRSQVYGLRAHGLI